MSEERIHNSTDLIELLQKYEKNIKENFLFILWIIKIRCTMLK